jgi:hypothetical protein
MKKTTLIKTMLLLCALIVGSGSVWADETETVTPTNSPSNGFSGADHFTYVTGGSGTASAFYASYVRLYANNTLTITPQGGETIKGVSISATWNKGGKGVNAAYPTGISSSPSATLGDATPGTGSHTITWSGSTTDEVVFTINGSKGNLQVTSITVTYTGGTKTDPTITFNDGSVRVGKTLDVSTLFTSNSAGTVTYSITSGGSYATLEGSTLTAGATTGDVTVQASQASAGSYNAKTATATISVVDPALSSIAITTAPTKTTYDEGDLFDKTGMVVTATFADASTENVTASSTWSPSGALSTSDVEVTVSYTYKGVTKTATQAITVNAYTQETQFDINFNDTFFGTSYGGTASGITDDAPVSGKLNKVNVIYAGSGNHYINNSQIRFYPNNKLTFEAPAGYIITKIVFTADGTWAATISSNKGTYTSSTKTWIGEASTVLFTGSGSSRCDMSKAAITLSSNASVKITSAKYATYCTPSALDFNGTGITVYTATDNETSVSLNEITSGKVPANTPVVLYKAGADGTAINVPVIASADAVGDNDLVVSDGTTAMSNAYVLANKSKGVGFYLWTGATLSAGKIYLQAKASYGAREFLGFNDDVTAIEAVKAQNVVKGEYFNLAGQRVAQPNKGLYIVNGKKVVNK